MSFGNPQVVRSSGTSVGSTPLPPGPTPASYGMAYYSGINVPVPASSAVIVPINTDVLDPGNNFDLANHWFKVPAAGGYLVIGQVEFNCNPGSSNTVQSQILVNGVVIVSGTGVPQGNNDYLDLPVVAILPLQVGDQITLRCNNPGAAGNINGTAGNQAINYLHVAKVV